MVAFSWNHWVSVLRQLGRPTGRRRALRMARVEGLEDRALLTANLPVAVNDVYDVDADTVLNGTSVLANDTDADGDTIDQAQISGLPSHGTLSLASNGTFTYTPDPGFSGTDSFTYFARDSTNSETSAGPATVTINVGSTSGIPTAFPVTINVAADTPFTGGLDGSDPEDDPLTFLPGSTPATHGTVSINADGSFTYTPGSGYAGPDSFSFKVNDGTSDSADALVTVNVGAATNNPPVAESVSIVTTKDTVFAGSLGGNDPDGDAITFQQGSTLAAHGTVSISLNGNFTYTPDVGYTGPDSFSFSVSDGVFASTSDGIVTIQVNNTGTGGNSVPVGVPVHIDVGLNTPFVGGLDATDADGDTLVFSQGSTAPQHGSVAINSNGTFTYSPNNGYTGPDSFSFRVSDGIDTSTDALVSIDVGGTPSNNAPVATPISINVGLNTTFAGTLSASDADGDPLVFSQGTTLAAHGIVNINSNGNFTYTPNTGFTGTDSFSFKVNDGTVNSANATVSVQVGTASNTPPVADPVSINVALNTTFAGSLGASDADGDPLVFSQGTTLAAHGIVNIAANGNFTYTPNSGFTGTDSFSFRVNDGTTNSADATVSVTVSGATNTPPVATPASINVGLNTTFIGTLSGTDADGDPLVFSAGSTLATHGVVNINPNGQFSYTPNTGYTGPDSFSFKVNDGTANSADVLVSIQVGGTGSNTPPTANSIIINVAQNTTFAGTLTGSDVDGDPLVFSTGSNLADHGTVQINPNGTFTYVPNIGFTGNDSFSFKVNDGTVNSAEATVTVHVIAASNSPPVAVPVSIHVGLNTAFNGTLAGFDADGDPLTFSAGSTPAAHGTVNINPNGTFTYTPDTGFTGSDSFSFKVNDGTVNSADATVSVQVGSASNTTPTAFASSINVLQNTAFTGTLSGSDVDGDPLTFLAGSVSATNGSVIINSDGSFIYNPFPGFTGSDLFSFKVNDGTTDSADAFISVNVGVAGNSPPVATPKNITVAPDATFNGTLSGTDPDFDPLTFLAGSTLPSHGTLVINSNGTFTYTPDAGFTGSDSFSFKVNDGTVNSAEATVSITVSSTTNTIPVAHPATVSTTTGVALSGTLIGSDADDDPLTFSLGSTAPQHGTVNLNSDGSYTYTPFAGFTGFDLFTFTVNDGTTDSPPANVIVNVTGVVNHTPTVTDGSGDVIADVTFNGSVSPLAVDADGDPLTFSVAIQPTHGQLTLSPDGTFVYVPDAGFTGTDFFTFTASDGSSVSNAATFNLTVSETSGGFTLVLSPTPGTIATSMSSIVPLDDSATLVNIGPSASFANAAVTADIISGSSSQDRIVVRDGSSVDIRGRKVRVNGTEVARLSGGRRGQALQIAFESNATADDVQAVIRRIGLKTSRRSGNDLRTVEITVNADGFSSSATIDANKA